MKINWKAFVRDLNLGHADNQDWLDLEQFVRVVVERECHVPQDSEFADECVQEIALKLHESKKFQKLKEARTPANYMYTVVKHSAADLVRSEDAEKRSIQKCAERLTRTQFANPAKIAERNENVERLEQAINLLSALDQDLIRSFHLGMDTIGELANRHGISPSSVTTKLARARNKIKRHLT